MESVLWVLFVLFAIGFFLVSFAWLNASERAEQAEADAIDAEEELDRLKAMLRLLAGEDDD